MLASMGFRELSPVLLAGALFLACSSSEDGTERAGEEARQALARGDRAAALDALQHLRESRTETPDSLLELAQLLIAAGEAPQALWRLEEGVQRFPARDDLRLALGQVAMMVGSPATARAALEPITSGSEHHAGALVLLAQAELQLGNLERALEILADAERLYPDRPEARLARIATLLTERRFDEARRALDAAKQSLHSDGEDREALRRLEIAFHTLQATQGETDEAISGLRVLVDADRSDVHGWQALVQTLWRAGRAEEALGLLRNAIEADPDHLALYPLIAPLYTAMGQPDHAERTLREFVEQSSSATAYLELANFYTRRQDEEHVLKLFAEAREAFPQNRMLRKFHTETLAWFGHIAGAQAEFERFEEDFPDDPNIEYLRARIELAEGKPATAAARLQKLMPELDQAATQFWLGQALEATGDRAGAERRYALALVRDPSDPALYPPLIRLAERRGDWRTVAATAQLLVRRAPALLDAWTALITALVNLGDGKSAERLARACVEVFKDRVEARLLLARALRAKGEHEAALEQLAEAGERFGRTPELDAERALTLGAGDRLEQAVAVAREALRTSPDSPELHLALAALLFQLSRADEGAHAVDRALELDPGEPVPLKIRAEFRASTGRLDGARKDCERYLMLRPDDPTVHFTLGVVHAKSGRTDQAIASYRRAAELDGTAFAPRNNLAALLAERDLDDALAVAQEAYAIAPDDTRVLDTLGWLYLQKGLVERAISLLEEAHAGAPERPDPHLHLALAYRAAGRTEEARRLLSNLQPRVDGTDRTRVDEALGSLP
jgi:tetratricopeptide (TPR) repeat protein